MVDFSSSTSKARCVLFLLCCEKFQVYMKDDATFLLTALPPLAGWVLWMFEYVCSQIICMHADRHLVRM